MRKIKSATEGYYHIFNRGVDRRDIFCDNEDYQKFYEQLYLFNDTEYRNPGNLLYHSESLLAGNQVLGAFRKPFVSILSYCLRPNHFHLFMRQNIDDGIEKFLHKLETGFAGYYNRKYDRRGRLFESTYRSVPITRQAHFMHLPRYIHLNALDDTAYEWREGKIYDWPSALRELDAFPWSSHHYYSGRAQELQVLDEEVINEVIDRSSYQDFLKEWATRPLPPFLGTDDVA